MLVFGKEAFFVGSDVGFTQVVLEWRIVGGEVFTAEIGRVVAPEIHRALV